MSDQSLIVVTNDRVALLPVAKSLRDNALVKASVIETVDNSEQQTLAVQVQRELHQLVLEIERARKSAKEPYFEVGRKIDAAAKEFTDQLIQEERRLSGLVSEFQVQEQERVQAELRRQAEEKNRIERERQAAIEKAEAEARAEQARKNAEALEAAKKADAAKLEEIKAKLAADAAANQAKLEAERKRQDELAKQAAEALGPLPEVTKAAGQVVKPDYEIVSTDKWKVVRSRPDLVRDIVLDLVAIRAELREGKTIPGIEARPVLKSSTRSSRQLVIDA